MNYDTPENRRGLLFSVCEETSEVLTKTNHKYATVCPFSPFNGDMLMYQVIFSGAGNLSKLRMHVLLVLITIIQETILTVTKRNPCPSNTKGNKNHFWEHHFQFTIEVNDIQY